MRVDLTEKTPDEDAIARCCVVANVPCDALQGRMVLLQGCADLVHTLGYKTDAVNNKSDDDYSQSDSAIIPSSTAILGANFVLGNASSQKVLNQQTTQQRPRWDELNIIMRKCPP